MTAIRLQQIDETNRRDHFYLKAEDECYFMYEYTAGAGWQGGATNQLIHNLQKKRGDGGYQYKAGAIAQSARAFSEAISANWLASAYLVPVPPSKIKTDASYDDRMYRVCLSIRKPEQPAIRELIEQIESTEAFKSGHRLKPEELRANYRFDESQMENLPETIGIIDDVLTTGAHFRAMKDMVSCTRFRRHRVRCFMEQEVCHGETSVYARVQA